MRSITFVILWCCSLATAGYAFQDSDADDDGLPDFQETHKYLTDPNVADSDGDGVPDGDWSERREYTYSVRTIVKVMRPCHPASMTDDYQDARVLSQTPRYVEFEVIHYPFNTNAEAIEASRTRQPVPSHLEEYLRPGITTNWDAAMQRDMLAELGKAGIVPAQLTDKEVVEKVSAWLLAYATYRDVFGTYFVHFPDGRAEILPGLEEAFARKAENTALPLEEHFQHELFGKGMYENKARGSCTSTAIYLTTGLRAVGIPTRMVMGIPAVDASDPSQVQMVRDNVSHHEVRAALLSALGSLGNSFADHVFNEVYVGGRWRRLNYRTLGQNILGEGAMGLMTHVLTFNDLSEVDLASTWGRRYGEQTRDHIFRFSNPYRSSEISDQFGPHCDMPNPPVSRTVTITKAYWFFSDERPGWIEADSVEGNGDGHILAHVDTAYNELRSVYPNLKKNFTLTASGHASVAARAERGYWNQECYFRIPETEFEKMVPGVMYALEPGEQQGDFRWEVSPGVRIAR